MAVSVGDLVATLKLDAAGFTSALDEASRQIQAVSTQVKQASGVHQEHQRATNLSTQAVHELAGAFSQVEGPIGTVAQSVSHLSGLLIGTGGLVVAITAVTAAAASLAMGLVDEMETFRNLSVQTGLSVEALQAFTEAAKEAGESPDKLIFGLGRINQAMGDVILGKEGLTDAFNRLGVDLVALTRDGASTQDVLQQLAAAFERIPDATERAAVAHEIFGTRGRAIITVLHEIAREGIDEYIRKQRELGNVVDEETAKLAEKWDKLRDDVMASMRGMMTGIKATILETVDAIKTAFDNIRSAIPDWFWSYLKMGVVGGVLPGAQLPVRAPAPPPEPGGPTERPPGWGQAQPQARTPRATAPTPAERRAAEEAQKEWERRLKKMSDDELAAEEKRIREAARLLEQGRQSSVQAAQDKVQAAEEEQRALNRIDEERAKRQEVQEKKNQELIAAGRAGEVQAAEAAIRDAEATQKALNAIDEEKTRRKEQQEKENRALVEKGRAGDVQAAQDEIDRRADLATQLRKIDEEKLRRKEEQEKKNQELVEKGNQGTFAAIDAQEEAEIAQGQFEAKMADERLKRKQDEEKRNQEFVNKGLQTTFAAIDAQEDADIAAGQMEARLADERQRRRNRELQSLQEMAGSMRQQTFAGQLQDMQSYFALIEEFRKKDLISDTVAWELKAQEQAKALDIMANGNQHYALLIAQAHVNAAKASGNAWATFTSAFVAETISWGTTFDKIAKMAADMAQTMARSLSDVFFDVITGKLKDLEDVWTAFWQSMLRMILDFLASEAVAMLARWLASLAGGGSFTLGFGGGGGGAGGGLLGVVGGVGQSAATSATGNYIAGLFGGGGAAAGGLVSSVGTGGVAMGGAGIAGAGAGPTVVSGMGLAGAGAAGAGAAGAGGAGFAFSGGASPLAAGAATGGGAAGSGAASAGMFSAFGGAAGAAAMAAPLIPFIYGLFTSMANRRTHDQRRAAEAIRDIQAFERNLAQGDIGAGNLLLGTVGVTDVAEHLKGASKALGISPEEVRQLLAQESSALHAAFLAQTQAIVQGTATAPPLTPYVALDAAGRPLQGRNAEADFTGVNRLQQMFGGMQGFGNLPAGIQQNIVNLGASFQDDRAALAQLVQAVSESLPNGLKLSAEQAQALVDQFLNMRTNMEGTNAATEALKALVLDTTNGVGDAAAEAKTFAEAMAAGQVPASDLQAIFQSLAQEHGPEFVHQLEQAVMNLGLSQEATAQLMAMIQEIASTEIVIPVSFDVGNMPGGGSAGGGGGGGSGGGGSMLYDPVSGLTLPASAYDPNTGRPRMQAGGWIGGVGNTDSKWVLATPGEFIMRKGAAQAVPGLMEALNRNPEAVLQAIQAGKGLSDEDRAILIRSNKLLESIRDGMRAPVRLTRGNVSV